MMGHLIQTWEHGAKWASQERGEMALRLTQLKQVARFGEKQGLSGHRKQQQERREQEGF